MYYISRIGMNNFLNFQTFLIPIKDVLEPWKDRHPLIDFKGKDTEFKDV